MINTNWSTPNTNIFAAMLNLRTALTSGYNARLIKMKNEDCAYPIKEKFDDKDFRNYKFSSGHLANRKTIFDDKYYSEFQKYLALNYKTCYGTQKAIDKYYKKGLLSPDNFKGIGISHLVNISDMIHFLVSTGDNDRAEMFKHQYFSIEGAKEMHLYDFYTYKNNSPYIIKKFKHKLWVVELLEKDEPKAKTPWLISIMNIILIPIYFIIKFIPKRDILKMKEYTKYKFRIGGIVNGFAIEFQIPKKFSFK